MSQLATHFRKLQGATVALLAGCAGVSIGAPSVASVPANVAAAHTTVGPHASNVVVIIMENRDYDLVIGSSQAPYINKTLVPEAALMTNSHAIGHPSQPNYLGLFSGSTQGVTDDSCPHTFSTENVGAELLNAGKGFDGYSESMPHDGYTGCYSGLYARKHNPWVNFTNVPATSNLVYHRFPVSPPTLAIVVPNLCHDMHDCSTKTGDTWLAKNVPPILKYNNAHDGLLIITWDEASPDNNGKNQIATLLIGPTVKPGSYAQKIDHYSVLRTIETITGVACTAKACTASDLKGMWH
ncbi:MAG TPA: alkaline phosphatase family protein [Candidatus Cybelea sp.]